jgi:hypothetical protein
MPDLDSVLADLKSRGKENYRAIYARHGIPYDRTWGVSNADLKLIAKTIKGQQELARQLHFSGNYDAMYLAGIVASGTKLSRAELQAWAEAGAGILPICDYTIAWLAVENPHGRELALEWIASGSATGRQPGKEHLAAAGWATYSGLVTTLPDAQLDFAEIQRLLDKVVAEIHTAPNDLRKPMNNFVISVGAYVTPLRAQAEAAARAIGRVLVDVDETDCKVPLATEYIAKIVSLGKAGIKRKTIRC